MMDNKYIEGLVSVVIPTYRRPDKLERAVESVLSQTYSDLELLLVNDNVPGDEFTQSLIKRTERYKNDSRFHLLMQEKHINGAVARNFAIKQAKGEYVAFLDDDDWWEPNKLEEQVKELSSLSEEWGGVSCKFTSYDANGNVLKKSKKYRDGYLYKDVLNMQSDVATGTLLLRHNYLDIAGYFDESLMRNQDLQLISQFTFKYKLKEVDQYLHCVDVSDTMNRPVNEETVLKYRHAFYKSIKPILDTLSSEEYQNMNAIRDVELGYILLRSGNYRRGFYYIMSFFKSIKVMKMAINKFISMN